MHAVAGIGIYWDHMDVVGSLAQLQCRNGWISALQEGQDRMGRRGSFPVWESTAGMHGALPRDEG